MTRRDEPNAPNASRLHTRTVDSHDSTDISESERTAHERFQRTPLPMPDGLPMTRMTSRDLRFSNEDRDFEQDDRSTSPTIVSESIPGSAYQIQQQLRMICQQRQKRDNSKLLGLVMGRL